MTKPTILTQAMMTRALADPKFYAQVPEFSTIKSKLASLEMIKKGGGCRGCKEKRVHQNVARDFQFTTLSLSPNALGRLKGYLGVQKIMMNVVNSTTNQIEVKII